MNIRTKFQLVTFVIPILLIGSITAYCYLVVIPEYSSVELERVEERMDHVRTIYSYMADNLDTMNWDWASWDDMYEYVDDPYVEFIESNYVPGTFMVNQINIMIISDTGGNIVWGRHVDLATGEDKVIPTDLLDHLSDGCIFNNSGTLILDDFVGIFSSRPILTSNDEGPSRGSHVMIRQIDSNFTEELSVLSQQNVSINILEGPITWDLVIEPEEKHMKASSLLPDNHGHNVAQLTFSYERSLFQKGAQNMRSLLVYLVVYGVVFIGISHYLAERLVLGRLTKLSEDLEGLSDAADPSMRLTEEGEDEVGTVTRNVNQLLNRIEAAQINETEQRNHIEDIRREHYTDLIESVRKISDLLNNEMTKPLSSAKNVAYMLRQEGNTELADVLENSLGQGERIVFELASLTSMSEVRKTVIDLNEILEAASLSVPKPNNIKYEMNLGDEFHALTLDGAKMTRVFENILANAVEAMPRGGTVRLSVENRIEGVDVLIEDTGVGMSVEEMESLFQPFYTNKKDAIGFGLVYAKQVVEAHGGTITVESVKGTGTKVLVHIPKVNGAQ